MSIDKPSITFPALRLAPLTASDIRVLKPKVFGHFLSLVNRVEFRRRIPVYAVTTAAESYLLEAGERAPSLMMVANIISLTPLTVGQSGGDFLGFGRLSTQGDNISHEDSFLIPELYLFSWS